MVTDDLPQVGVADDVADGDLAGEPYERMSSCGLPEECCRAAGGHLLAGVVGGVDEPVRDRREQRPLAVEETPPPGVASGSTARRAQSGALTLRIWAHGMTRVSRAVCTLSIASRAFSRAMSFGDDVPTMLMPK